MNKKIKLFSLVAILILALSFSGCLFDSAPSKTASLKVLNGQKTEYLVGESMATYNLRFYEDIENMNNAKDITSSSEGVTVSGFSTTSAGEGTITFTYKSKTATLSYTVYNIPTTLSNVEDGEYLLKSDVVLKVNNTNKSITISNYENYEQYKINSPASTLTVNYTLAVKSGVVVGNFVYQQKNYSIYYDSTYCRVMVSVDGSYSAISKINTSSFVELKTGYYALFDTEEHYSNSPNRFQIDEQGNRVSNGEGGYVRIYFNVFAQVSADNKMSVWIIDHGTDKRTDILTNQEFEYKITANGLRIKFKSSDVDCSASVKTEEKLSFVKNEQDYVNFGFSATMNYSEVA